MKTSALIWSLVGVVLASQLAAAQSLGEVARKEEARRKTIKTPGRLYTNDDLRRFPVSTEPAPPPPAPAAAEPAAKPDKAGAPEKGEDTDLTVDRGEAFWRKRMGDVRDQLERNKKALDTLQSRMDVLTQDFYAREDGPERAAVWAQRAKVVEDFDRIQKDNAELERAIVRIQEEARRANVPPGWIR
jgi:hypothetical protein